ncbi:MULTISPECIES: DNA ligase [unclassified Marinobacter]|uniref:DNA ligase n=1 Tax=unclassified Marinobacter TaxID=83889 RepID=UPI00200D2C9D|nr:MULTISPECIES: DNA ligase [unclassified Marinobacter]MCL1477684.1 DNA ligase [Marinobacter sp.]MCL1482263.1 DNA ligase [Marinobacter sp.]MCL1485805.1 DNA ligase [Marinobacter sp.]UQG55757.1 DNA ligase [Marinobacter sp. M4C]UQG64561.1 DNA ligase [Marinobacter sp. M2C]
MSGILWTKRLGSGLLASLALMTAVVLGAPAKVPLANVYQQGAPLADYWVSEKLDGVRAYWDGERLWSRRGNPFQAPDWFVSDFPPQPLDGELWLGRGHFAQLSGIVRTVRPVDADWRSVRFMVFDLPLIDQTFDQRLPRLRELVSQAGSPYLALVEQQRPGSHQQLMARRDKMIAVGGEGLMLRRGASLYKAGRSDDLLKVKRFDDAEAIVVGILPGKGKYQGMMGALRVRLAGKREFRIGSGFSDAERAEPPPLGSVITFKHFGHTATGLPRFASFMRVRNDEPESPGIQ